MEGIDNLKKGMAEIIEQSHPGCGLKAECSTKCGECGADRILSLLANNEASIRTEHGQMMIRDLLR